MPPAPLVLLLYALAVARMTTIVTTDEITRPVRQALIRRFNPTKRIHRWLVYLLGTADDRANGCPWCVSIWIAGASAPLLWYHHHNPITMIIMMALAASQITGMIFKIGRN